VSGLNHHTPVIFFILQRLWNQAERGAKSLDLKRLDPNATKFDWTKLSKTPLEYASSVLCIKLGPGAQIINVCLSKASLGVENIERNKLASGVAINGRNKRGGEEELCAVRGAPDVAGIMLVVINN